jgi:predicted kinase
MKVYLIYGPPCSGKTHYIKEHMQDGDIVCEVDDIYAAISGNDPHDADLYVHEVALELR